MTPLFPSPLQKAALAGTLAALFCAAAPGFAGPDTPERVVLRFIQSHKIADKEHDFTEVSGLALAQEGGFWSVSDDTARVFRLDDKGKVRKKASLPSEPGLEGVSPDPAGGRILVVREDTSEILALAEDGIVTRHSIQEMDGAADLAMYFSASDANDGLEGITVDPATGTVFVLKERTPRLLIEIEPDLSRVRRIVPLTETAGFASDQADDDHLDVSGLEWDASRQALWITSDTGKAIFLFSLSTLQARGWALVREDKGKTRRVSNAEGVALGVDGQTIFVVTDDGNDSRLLEYRID
ncbi:SdiA-regulated domain-containing protein [Primorskyibacter sp. 2E233]|uniref:SdiA-regulated domain-containing protein n=1 Tax=Primorskyibacter sp. 2E233 TaxID=3413431 RepID=UPI003BF3318C